MVLYILPMSELERVVMDQVLQRTDWSHEILVLDLHDNDTFRGDSYYGQPPKKEEGYRELRIYVKDSLVLSRR